MHKVVRTAAEFDYIYIVLNTSYGYILIKNILCQVVTRMPPCISDLVS
jgi:hypothetical protein